MAFEQTSLFDAPPVRPRPSVAGGAPSKRRPQALTSPFLDAAEPSALSAADLRDRGAARVIAHAGDDWKVQAIACIRHHWAGREGIAEDFRRTCEAAGIAPHHPNAWGALTLAMKRQELLEETGEWRSPSDHKSHARPTRVYRVR